MTDFADSEWGWLQQNPALTDTLKRAFEKGNITREKFGLGLHAMLGEETQQQLTPDEKRHAEMICFIEGTRKLRLEIVRALQEEGLVTRGDKAWRDITPQCDTFLNYETELPAYYRHCPINLNTTSIQMPTAVNQRVFDCPAAGGFLLTDQQQTLTDLFDTDSEVATYQSPTECRDQLRHYTQNPQQPNHQNRQHNRLNDRNPAF
jgi:hypothetical protein